MTTLPTTNESDYSRERVAGWAIVAASVVSLAAVAAHPVAGKRAVADVLPLVVQMAEHDRIVHGVLIAIFAAMTAAFAIFSERLGFGRPWVILGFVAFCVGTGATVAAATIDGFMVPDVAAHYLGGSADQLREAAAALSLCAVAIQDFTRVALAVYSGAIFAWSIALLHDPRRAPRISGLFGAATGIGSFAAMCLTGHLEPWTLLPLLAGQTIWYASAGVLLIRRLV